MVVHRARDRPRQWAAAAAVFLASDAAGYVSGSELAMDGFAQV
ncbi:hypothetical protein [Nocardia brasiliensis]|nr:hypothetical protein [Nocardia brasiliensis]